MNELGPVGFYRRVLREGWDGVKYFGNAFRSRKHLPATKPTNRGLAMNDIVTTNNPKSPLTGGNYFDRQGRPITPERWSELFADRKYQILRQTKVGPHLVSTVWLGVDHSLGGPEPIIFETMAFADGYPEDQEPVRARGEGEAMANHMAAIRRLGNWWKENYNGGRA